MVVDAFLLFGVVVVVVVVRLAGELVEVVLDAIRWLVAGDTTELDGRLVRRGFTFSLFDFAVFLEFSFPALLLFPPFAGFLFPAPFFLCSPPPPAAAAAAAAAAAPPPPPPPPCSPAAL